MSVVGWPHFLMYLARKIASQENIAAKKKQVEIWPRFVPSISICSPTIVVGRLSIKAVTKLSYKVALTSALSGGPSFIRVHSSEPETVCDSS